MQRTTTGQVERYARARLAGDNAVDVCAAWAARTPDPDLRDVIWATTLLDEQATTLAGLAAHGATPGVIAAAEIAAGRLPVALACPQGRRLAYALARLVHNGE